jgi:hypothetical protein
VKKPLKHVRIVTDKGDTLFIHPESLQCLLRSLELLASGQQVRSAATTQSKK